MTEKDLEKSYKATLEILQILEKYKLSYKDAVIVFNIILSVSEELK